MSNAIQFSPTSVSDHTFSKQGATTSRYDKLIEAALDLEDGQAIAVKIPEDVNASKYATNLRAALRNRGRDQLEEGYTFSVRIPVERDKVIVAIRPAVNRTN